MRSLRQLFALCFIVWEAHLGQAQPARWTEANTGLAAGSNPGIRTLAIDQAGSTLYTVTGGQGIFSSRDGGSNWHALGRISGALVVAFAPMSPSTVYAGTRHGVRRSRDGGENWTAGGLFDPVSVLAVDPITPSILYAAVGDKLYKSTDGATTWTLLDLR